MGKDQQSCKLIIEFYLQVPDLEEINKGNIYISITSPTSVIRTYHQQFQKDFSAFLKCRSEEMVTGGRMVLTILGRISDDPTSKECCYIWELLSKALRDMVSQACLCKNSAKSIQIVTDNYNE